MIQASTAEKAGAGALVGAALLAPVSPSAAAALLAAFAAACGAAPFFPQIGFFFPVVSRGPRSTKAVALTFDDGPDPDATPALLDLLDRRRSPAAFFVVGSRAEAHPALVRELVLRGHEVGCHSYRHDLLLGMRSPGTVIEDLQRAAGALGRLGIRPLAFRPPAGVLTPRIGQGVRAAGMYALTFSRRGFDAGNRRLTGLADRILRRLKPGDVILMHDVLPRARGLCGAWLGEVERTIDGIERRGLKIAPLSALIGRPVMETISGADSEGS